jgi:hypothetical protein
MLADEQAYAQLYTSVAQCCEPTVRRCAGMSTGRGRPAEVFAANELPHLKPVPDTVFDIPRSTHPKVAPDGAYAGQCQKSKPVPPTASD